MEATAKLILEKYDRGKILEIYFSRLNGKTMKEVPHEYADLYEVDLNIVRAYLLGQPTEGTNLFRLMS